MNRVRDRAACPLRGHTLRAGRRRDPWTRGGFKWRQRKTL